MAGFGWTGRLLGRKAAHPLLDPRQSQQMVSELRRQSPDRMVGEAAALLDSVEAETELELADRLKIVTMIDEAVHDGLAELQLQYAGARTGSAGRLQDWRVLQEYLKRLLSGYLAVVETEAGAATTGRTAAQLELSVLRAMRTATFQLVVGWMRYLPPERRCWEALACCYRFAADRKLAALIAAYPGEQHRTCATYELAAAVMLGAAAHGNLTPLGLQLMLQIALACGAFFSHAASPDPRRRWAFDLQQPCMPTRVDPCAAEGASRLYFGGGSALTQLESLLEAFRVKGPSTLAGAYGEAFAPADVAGAIEHALRFWGNDPPARREERRRVTTPIEVALGMAALERVLRRARDAGATTLALVDDAQKHTGTEMGAVLVDFSPRGIGARFAPRASADLRVGGVLGFRLERSDKWGVAIVRRLRSDPGNQIEAGAEIIAKAATMVALSPLDQAGSEANASLHSLCVLLPEDPQLKLGPTLLFEPGTNEPGQIVEMEQDGTVRRIRLGYVTEEIEQLERVTFEWVS
jgi:cyclic-di-GMP-binding protein